MYKWVTQCYKACLELPTQLECWASILALTSGITRTSELPAIAPAALYPQWNFFALISARGWVGPRATVRRQKEYATWKFPRTLSGIETGTARLVAARPNSCNYGNNTQTHSILRLLFLPDTVSQCPVTEHNSLYGHGPVTVFFQHRPFSLWRETFIKVCGYLLRFVQVICLVLYDVKWLPTWRRVLVRFQYAESWGCKQCPYFYMRCLNAFSIANNTQLQRK
jgi:hypothetical protein